MSLLRRAIQGLLFVESDKPAATPPIVVMTSGSPYDERIFRLLRE